MNTKFKLINGNIFSIPLEQDMTIEEVKDIIRNQKGYDDGEIVLIFKANKLRDYQILRKLRYKPEDTIFIHKKKSKREKQQIPLQYRAKIPQYGRNDNQYRQQIPPQNNQTHFRRNENIPSEKDIQSVIEYTCVDRSLAEAALIRYHLNVDVTINHILSNDMDDVIINNNNNNYNDNINYNDNY